MNELQSFEEISSSVLRSVVAIAIGLNLSDEPNIVGTGFSAVWPECFATCWHVAELEDKYKTLSKEQLERDFNLIDNKLRVGTRVGIDEYKWHVVEENTWFRISDKKADICVYRAIGVPVLPLNLYHGEDYPCGSEVGVMGFPLGNILQGKVLRPFWSKTIIAGGLELKLENGEDTPRLALDSSFAGGFSGAPVFLTTSGEVVGMIASKILEPDESGRVWPAGISLAVPASIIVKLVGAGMDKTTEIIKNSLHKTIEEKTKGSKMGN